MKKEILKFVVLLAVALGAAPAYSAFYQWSKTSSNNATADASINWSEGQSPSSVNDSARAMMARLADYRDDISGSLTLGGTSTAYTLTTNQGLAATPVTGQMIAFKPNVANGDAATLTVDGGTTFPLQSTAGTALSAATLLAGTPYRASFSGSAWVMEGGYGNPYGTALGAIMWSTAPTAPNSNFVAPSGQCISTTTYAAYWVQQGSPARGGCPGGQFALIDMRGRVPVALDTLNASAANRLTNAATGCGTAMTTVGTSCANGTQSKTIVTLNLPPYTPSGANSVSGGTQGGNVASDGIIGAGGSVGPLGRAPIVVGFTGTAQGGTSQPLPSVDPNIGLIPYLRIL